MVSRRNFFAIGIIMVITFFLFMFSTAAKEQLNDYETNEYAEEETELLTSDTAYQMDEESGTDETEHTGEAADLLVYIGEDLESGTGEVVYNWGLYMKWNVVCCRSLTAYESAAASGKISTPRLLVIDPDQLDLADEAVSAELEEYVENGINLIFSSLPDVSIIQENEGLQSLLGIKEIVAESTTVAGIHLYEGLLLGGQNIYQETSGEEEYQDMELTFPWYHLDSGTKVYMKGIPEDESVETEEYPVLIWRKSYGSAYVFAVNGTYMEDASGLGILTGMLNETQSYTIYPVINAQNLIVADFPGLADENEEELQELYSQSMSGVLRDIIWPSLASVYEQNNLGISFMMAIQFDYDDDNLPDEEEAVYYMKLINELEGETGLSGFSASDIDIADKLEEDESFWQQILPKYEFTSFYTGELTTQEVKEALEEPLLSKIRTVVENFDTDSDIVGYQAESVTRQKAVVYGYEYTFSSDFRMRSIESALGYTSIIADIGEALYPEDEEYTWEKLSERLAAGVNTYTNKFAVFDGTTVTESDQRIRNFLAMDYSEEREGDQVTLQTGNVDDTVWFILRTHNEVIEDIQGGSYEEIEDNAYLIEADESTVVITLGKSDERYYY